MKKIFLTIISVCALILTSCTNEGMEFDTIGGNGLAFVHFVGNKQTFVAKDGAANTWTIEISANILSNVDRNYNLVINENSTAKEGDQYALSSKSITIKAGEYSGKVAFTANFDELTPEEVIILLEIDSEDAIDYGKTMQISLSSFFEVTMEWLVGNWTAYDYEGSDPAGDYPVTITQIDDNTISIFNIWDGEEAVTATVDFENSTIALTPDALIYQYPGYGDVTLCAIVDGARSKTEPTIGNCAFSGITLQKYGVYLDAIGYVFTENGSTVFKK